MQFKEFSLSSDLQKGIESAGYETCTSVQEETLQYTLEGKDVFVQSQTGTGKTGAFLISLFELLERGNSDDKAIILAPTRELVTQISTEAKLLGLYLNYNVVEIVGGVSYDKQERDLSRKVSIVIATPGRTIDLVNKRMLNLKDFTFAVIDEADRMFDMGFINDIRKILSKMPSKSLRHTMLFSATLSFSVKQLASDYMQNPEEILIQSNNITVSNINQKLYHVGSHEKLRFLIGLLKSPSYNQAIIFSNTKKFCEIIAFRLKYNGFDADFLTGDLPQNKRQRIVNNFKEKKLKILIATDVAARGIHIDDLELVINYDIPTHNENYVHRIGRTARAGKTGTAITLACEEFVEYLSAVESYIKMKIPSEVPDEELFFTDLSENKSLSQVIKKINPKSVQQSPKKKSSSNRTTHSRPTSEKRHIQRKTSFSPDEDEGVNKPRRKNSRKKHSDTHKNQKTSSNKQYQTKKKPQKKKSIFAKIASFFRFS